MNFRLRYNPSLDCHDHQASVDKKNILRRDVGDVCDDNEADADLFSCEPPILTEKAEGKL